MANPRRVTTRPNPRRVTTPPSERKRLVNLHRKIKSLYENQGEALDVEIEVISDNPAEKPGFPIVMFTFACLKDFLDTFDLTLIGMPFTTVLSAFLTVALFVWVTFRLSGGGWWKRKMIAWVWLRIIPTVLIEFVPLLKIVPATTIFILMVHNQENKLVQLANESLEMIRSVGIKFK